MKMKLSVSILCYIFSSYFVFFTGGIAPQNSSSDVLRGNTISERSRFYTHFNLYTQTNTYQRQQLIAHVDKSVRNSNFRNSSPTILVTHGRSDIIGWESATSIIRQAYLERENAVNVIEVLWATKESGLLFTRDSIITKDVGMAIAEMINYLKNSTGLRPTSITLVGHALGADIMGVAGKYVEGDKINQIFGLDPARISDEGEEWRLSSLSARNVQVIHTSGNYSHSLETSGHAYFYPNGGLAQPGCENKDSLSNGHCSYERAIWYFAESLNSPIGFIAHKCKQTESPFEGPCSGEAVLMGGRSNQINLEGKYYVTTSNSTPYAQYIANRR